MLVNLKLQARLFAHYFLEKRHKERVWPATEIRKVNCKKTRVGPYYFSSPQDFLAVGPVNTLVQKFVTEFGLMKIEHIHRYYVDAKVGKLLG